MQDPITDVREISRIAYGFKAGKALLVAIDLDLFSRLSGGRLYLNYSKGVQAQWSEDIPGNIARGERNWPKVLGN